MIEKTIYQCEHCTEFTSRPRKLMNKSKMKQHEQDCLYNKRNATCFSCHYNTEVFDPERSVLEHLCGYGVFKEPITNKNARRNCKEHAYKYEMLELESLGLLGE